MIIYPNIEQYIETIGGWRDITGQPKFWGSGMILQLSDFDEQFVSSVGEALSRGLALTDKQAAIAERIIVTYADQLAAHNIGQPDHRNYRFGIRTINRQSCLTLADNKLLLRFPFDAVIIGQIKEFAKTSQGKVTWQGEEKIWEFANTEYNLSWVVALAQSHNIEVAANCQELFDRIIEAEQTPYAIELVYNDGKFSITNAPDSMVEYIENSIGFENIYSLVDMAGALGYTVSDEIRSLMASELGEAFMKLCSDRTINMPVSSELSDIVEWAIAVDRLPICIYAPNFTKPRLGCLPTYFTEDEIVVIRPTDPVPLPYVVPEGVKVIYTTQVIPEWEKRLPLLISQVNLMYGTSKRAFVDVAEKLVYHCQILPKASNSSFNRR